MASTYKQLEPTSFNSLSPSCEQGFEYSRCNNPTRPVLEQSLACLENAKYSLSFGSGISAITTLIYLMKYGDHLVTVVLIYYFN